MGETQLTTTVSLDRRHDIDWLRAILFGLLIPFHVAVGLVWGVYGTSFDGQTASTAYNNNVVVENFILLWMHTWRLPAIFLISGMGTAFAFRKKNPSAFRRERFRRLVVPFLFGITFVNLPFWILASGAVPDDTGELIFVILITGLVIGFLNLVTLFELSVHLWFLKNLFIYSVILSFLLSKHLTTISVKFKAFTRAILKLPKDIGLLVVIPIPLLLVELFYKPSHYGFTGHGYEFYWYFVFFLLGFVLITHRDIYFVILTEVRIKLTHIDITI